MNNQMIESNDTTDMTIEALHRAYKAQTLTPAQLMADIRQRSAKYSAHNIWIHQLNEQEQQPYIDALADKPIESSPLWGIPFVIKDNIDLANIPTTAACVEFAYTPTQSSTVVKQLIAAGAIPVGKANLDQFATGLNGTRSPFGPCKNAFNSDYISGGSSSGSAVSVALGLASFSLGTDTAGSGRVPACFNNLVGLKPSRGLLSATGLVPACRSLDCISIFALSTNDANQVLACAEGYDPQDGYSRVNPYHNQARQYGQRQGEITVGIIPTEQLKFFGDDDYQAAYLDTLAKLSLAGIECVEIDYAPFDEVAKLLYEGPWVAERYLAIESLIQEKPEALLPVIRTIIEPGGEPKAIELFSAQYRLEELKAVCLEQLKQVDCLLTPTAGRLFTINEMLAEPIKHNSELGYYTNFMNLIDLTSIAIPTTFTSKGLPFGITLVGNTFSDRALLSIANKIEQELQLPLGAVGTSVPAANTTPVNSTDTVDVVVCGAHLEGLPLNWQLKERGAVLKEITSTAPCYRMYALAGGPPFRPALMREASESKLDNKGSSIAVEVWSVPTSELGSFVANIPAPLGIGKLELIDGRWLTGFISESYEIAAAEEITHFGGWRAYLNSSN